MNEKELRELDAWIAEHVFGWHKVQIGDNHSLCSVCGNGFGARHKHYIPEFHGSMTGSVPFYSTDPADSMQILEKCAEKLSGQFSHAILICVHEGVWHVSSSNGCRGESETLPLAVAKFAKKMFGK